MKHGAPPQCGLNKGRKHEVSFRSSSGRRHGGKLRRRRKCRRGMRTGLAPRALWRMRGQSPRGRGGTAGGGGRGGASRAHMPLWHRLALRTLPGLLSMARRTKAKPRASGFFWPLRFERPMHRPRNSEGGKSRPQASLNSNVGASSGDASGDGASPSAGGDASPNDGGGASPSDGGGASPSDGDGPSPGGVRGPSALLRA